MELFKLFGTIAVKNDEANKALDETSGKGEQAESKLSSAFKKIGAAVATYFAVDKIISFGKEIVNVAAEVSAETSAFEQIMGDYADEASKKVGKIADATGMVSTRLTPYMTSMTAKFKGLGYDITDATDYASRGLNLAADAAAFWDKSLDDSMGHLNSFINGSYEGGEAIGLFANDTQMAAYAVKTGVVDTTKAWSALDEKTKQATRLEYAENMFKMSGATGQAAKEADQYANVQANLTEKWRQFKAQIGEPILQNIVLPAMSKLSGLVDIASAKFQDLKQWVSDNRETFEKLASKVKDVANKFKEFVNWIKGGSAGAKALKTIIVALTAAFVAYKTVTLAITAAQKAQIIWTKAVAAAQTILNTVMSMNPIGLVIAAIAALVAAFIYLWNNCEGFRNFWINLWENIKEIAGAVADWFSEKWQAISDWFIELWENIKNAIFAAWEWIKEAVTTAIDAVSNIITTVFNAVKNFVTKVWNGIKNIISKVWNGIKTVVTNAINGVKTIITNVFNAIKTVITKVWNAIKTVITTVWNAIKTVVTNAINAVKNKVTSVFNAVKNTVTSIWNGIKSTISSVWNGIKSTVSSAVENVKSKVTSVFNSVKSTVTSVWNGIRDAIKKPIEKARDLVKNAIDKIKGFFNFKFTWPKLSLPHFAISPSGWKIGDLLKGSIPKLSIEWYAKAMNNPIIMTRPTLFGMSGNGELMAGGEAGAEVVSGAKTLMAMIRGTVQNEISGTEQRLETLISMLSKYMPELVMNSKKEIRLNSGILVGELASDMDYKLGEINRLRERGH